MEKLKDEVDDDKCENELYISVCSIILIYLNKMLQTQTEDVLDRCPSVSLQSLDLPNVLQPQAMGRPEATKIEFSNDYVEEAEENILKIDNSVSKMEVKVTNDDKPMVSLREPSPDECLTTRPQDKDNIPPPRPPPPLPEADPHQMTSTKIFEASKDESEVISSLQNETVLEDKIPVKWRPNCDAEDRDIPGYRRVKPVLGQGRVEKEERIQSPPCPHVWETHEDIARIQEQLKKSWWNCGGGGG